METGPQTIVCNICRKGKDSNEFKIKNIGIRNKGCKKCLAEMKIRNEKYKCVHGKQKSICFDCICVRTFQHKSTQTQ